MATRSIGEILGGLEPAKEFRTFAPVRRNSYYADDRRALGIWRPIASTKRDARREIAARLKAAEFYDRHQKQAGKRNGPLGHIALEVLRELYRIVDYSTGRLEPAIDTICDRIKRSRAAIVAAMARLRDHGFLNWVRRSEKTDVEGQGPQIRQITNAYGFGLPAMAAAWVRKTIGATPTPDCEADRRKAQAADLQAMLDGVSTDELVEFTVDDPELARLLKSVGRKLSRNGASSPSGQNPAPE